MSKDANDYSDTYTEPELREQLKEAIKRGDKGGKPGQWSARKSQLLTLEYEKQGGGYKNDSGSKTKGQERLDTWQQEEWQTKEGGANARTDDGETKRYLPKKAWQRLSEQEKKETDEKKRQASKTGRQYVDNTKAAKEARKKT